MKRRKVVAIVAGAIGAVAITTAAWAYLTSHGSGTGSVSAATVQTVTISATAGSPTSTLLPGGSPADVALKVTNPNPFAVTLISVVGAGSITADAGHSACTTTGVGFADQTGLNINIPASATTAVDLPAAASMSTSSSNGCQGAMFSIPVTITVHK